ncbi:MAG: phosphoribosyl-ATP diphosphatase [Eubacteriales bacterium]|nr:phosphoribosyl-ATP diphosphatase [Eubacteriales bacterium]
MDLNSILAEVYSVIEDRRDNPVSGAYSSYLFEKGEDQVLKKFISQSAGLALAVKNEDKADAIERLGDVVYHLLVLMVEEGFKLEDLEAVMRGRRGTR